MRVMFSILSFLLLLSACGGQRAELSELRNRVVEPYSELSISTLIHLQSNSTPLAQMELMIVTGGIALPGELTIGPLRIIGLENCSNNIYVTTVFPYNSLNKLIQGGKTIQLPAIFLPSKRRNQQLKFTSIGSLVLQSGHNGLNSDLILEIEYSYYYNNNNNIISEESTCRFPINKLTDLMGKPIVWNNRSRIICWIYIGHRPNCPYYREKNNDVQNVFLPLNIDTSI